jgi:hypothetical protein
VDSKECDQGGGQAADADERVELEGAKSAPNRTLDERGDANEHSVHRDRPKCEDHQAVISSDAIGSLRTRPVRAPFWGRPRSDEAGCRPRQPGVAELERFTDRPALPVTTSTFNARPEQKADLRLPVGATYESQHAAGIAPKDKPSAP